ncbi:LytR/AlgR family response regulator transcription factor [Heyndrickxia sp. NPDC080065]|uniref:LytR/AlgR family response regulator transcription factor n=1 Tax=Heyndrickxia sp. NPDC080065 TaxID=3390568 RepID=UPI003D07F516
MRVAICEDNIFHRELIFKTINNYSLFHEPSIEIVLCTDSPNQLLQQMQSKQIDCYILDIELNEVINGMDIAISIREKDPLAQIIFITTHANRLELTFTYKLAALDFIVKDSPEQIKSKVIEALQAAYTKYRKIGQIDSSKWFQIKVGEKVKNINLHDIYFIETSPQPHKLELYEKNGCHTFYATLKELDYLGDNFFRCHKSYLINLEHVIEYNVKDRLVVMKNKAKCPVSFRLMRELKKKLISLDKGTNQENVKLNL